MNNFSEQYLRDLVAEKVQGDFPPFKSGKYTTVVKYIKEIVGRLSDNKAWIVEADYENYQSGFSSFVPVKISKKDKSDSIIKKENGLIIEDKDALLIYFSKLSPYWYYSQGRWTDFIRDGKNSPSTHFIRPDEQKKVNQILWANDIEKLTRQLEEYRYTLLDRKEVTKDLDFKIEIPTRIADRTYQVFDCFFYWED
jgi:hypothetical protein